MGMIGNLRLASDAEIERLLANPPEITRFLYGADADRGEGVAIHKAWHAIHFVLTGTRLGGAEPLNFLASEGTSVGDVDVGYGPARVLTSRQVRDLATALDRLSLEEVTHRVDLDLLDQEAIYPGKWLQNGLGVDYVVAHYRDMCTLIQRAADTGQGLVLYIN